MMPKTIQKNYTLFLLCLLSGILSLLLLRQLTNYAYDLFVTHHTLIRTILRVFIACCAQCSAICFYF